METFLSSSKRNVLILSHWKKYKKFNTNPIINLFSPQSVKLNLFETQTIYYALTENIENSKYILSKTLTALPCIIFLCFTEIINPDMTKLHHENFKNTFIFMNILQIQISPIRY